MYNNSHCNRQIPQFLTLLQTVQTCFAHSCRTSAIFIVLFAGISSLGYLSLHLLGLPGILKGQPRKPDQGSSPSRKAFHLGTRKAFHPCTTPGCRQNVPGQYPHAQCFRCLTDTCGPCLTSPAQLQQSGAIRLYLWHCEPCSLPLPVFTVGKGITRLTLQLGSIDQARRWLAKWNLAFLEWRASCLPLSVTPVTSTSTLASSTTLSGSQPEVAGSLRVAHHQ